NFEILVGHDQRLDRAAHVSVTHRDRLVAGLLVPAGVRQRGWVGHARNSCDGQKGLWMFLFCSCGVKRPNDTFIENLHSASREDQHWPRRAEPRRAKTIWGA